MPAGREVLFSKEIKKHTVNMKQQLISSWLLWSANTAAYKWCLNLTCRKASCLKLHVSLRPLLPLVMLLLRLLQPCCTARPVRAAAVAAVAGACIA
jgi:hypothetical protein